MSSSNWDASESMWQGQFQPSTNSSMTPGQEQFYHNYLNGLFMSLGMPEIAACFQNDGSGADGMFATFPSQDMASGTTSGSQQSPE